MTIEPYNYNDEPSGRVDTLAMALDKCERLEKQLKIALRGLNFIIAQSYGKDKSHGFDWEYKDIIDKLEKKDKCFTYASPEELALNDHQREWTAKDRIYYNKLKYHYKQLEYKLVDVMIRAKELER